MSAPRGEIGYAATINTVVAERDPLVHLDEIVKFAFAHLGSMEDAEDVAVEVFEAVHRMGGRLSNKKDPRPYIFGIARRKVADKLRSRSPVQPSNETEGPDLAEQSLLKLQVGQALKHLPDQQREVLLLKYLHGFSTKEIASIVGKSSEAVNSLLQRARAAFVEQASDLIS